MELQTVTWLGASFGLATVMAIVVLVMYSKLVDLIISPPRKVPEELSSLTETNRAICNRLDRIEEQRR